MCKSIFIKADFQPEYKTIEVKVPTGEVKKNFLGKEKPVKKKEYKYEPTGKLDVGQINGKKLAEDLQSEVEKLQAQGFIIQSVTPVTSGRYNYQYKEQEIKSSKRISSETESVSGGASYGYGYGYSYTEGLIVLANKA